MRDLKTYPVTTRDKMHALESAIELITAQGKLGDIRPVALRAIARDLSLQEATLDADRPEGTAA